MFTATGTVSALARRAKMVVAAGFLTLALVVGAGIGSTPVGAYPVGPGIDGFSQACRGLQDRAQALRDEYSRVGRENPFSPRLGEILTELRSIGTTWNQIGCGSVFGTILLEVQPLPHHGIVVSVPMGGTRAQVQG